MTSPWPPGLQTVRDCETGPRGYTTTHGVVVIDPSPDALRPDPLLSATSAETRPSDFPSQFRLRCVPRHGAPPSPLDLLLRILSSPVDLVLWGFPGGTETGPFVSDTEVGTPVSGQGTE